MSRLLLHYREHGLLHGLINKIDETAIDSSHYELEKLLLIEVWDCATDSGLPDNPSPTALLGRRDRKSVM
jgi:hypothetical protein